MKMPAEFAKITPYFTNPLVLIKSGGVIVQSLLRYGAILALLVVLPGLGPEFYKIRGETVPAYRQATQLEPEDAKGWNQLGHSLRRTGKLEEAIAAYRKALEIGEATGDLSMLAAAHGNLGGVYKTRGELEKAEEYYRKALEIFEAMDSKEDIAITYNHLGILNGTRGKLENAEYYSRKALKLNKELDSKKGMANNYANLGTIYKTLGNLEVAEHYSRKAKELNKALGRKAP